MGQSLLKPPPETRDTHSGRARAVSIVRALICSATWSSLRELRRERGLTHNSIDFTKLPSVQAVGHRGRRLKERLGRGHWQ